MLKRIQEFVLRSEANRIRWAWPTTWRLNVWNKRTWYYITYRYIRFMPWLGLALSLVVLYWQGGEFTLWPFLPLVASLLVWLLTLSCWFSPDFRYLALKVTSWISRPLRWLNTKKRLFVILTLAYLVAENPPRFLPPDEIFEKLASADSALRIIFSIWASWRAAFQALDLNYVLKAAGTILFVGILYWLFWSRPSWTFAAFNNHSGNKSLDGPVGGLPSFLADRLTQLNRLFQVIDEARPEEAGTTVKPLIGVGSTTHYFKEFQGNVSIGAPSKFQLSVPVNTMVRGLRKLTRGSTLSGSVLKDGVHLVISAELGGPRRKRSWQVRQDELSNEGRRKAAPGDAAALPEMAEELVFRIFTDQVDVGSPRWKAVRHYSNGLRLYRDTMLTRTDREVKLRKAEKEFLQALEEDEEFAMCWYNLGIVYRKLDASRAAKAAFQRASEKNPQSRDAYFALAFIAFKTDCFEECIQFCERVIRLEAREARAWDMKGFALRKLKDQKEAQRMLAPRKDADKGQDDAEIKCLCEGKNPPGPVQAKAKVGTENREFWQENLPIRAIATALAWRNLSIAHPKRRLELQDVGAVCTHNLAVAYTYLGKNWSALRHYYQSIHLRPSREITFLEAAGVHERNNDWGNAAELFETALGIRQQTRLWAFLGYTKACKLSKTINEYQGQQPRDLKRKVIGATIDPLKRAMEEPSKADRLTLEFFLKSLEKLNQFSAELGSNKGPNFAIFFRELQDLNHYRRWAVNSLLQILVKDMYLSKAEEYSKMMIRISKHEGATSGEPARHFEIENGCYILSRLNDVQLLFESRQREKAKSHSGNIILYLKGLNAVDRLSQMSEKRLSEKLSTDCPKLCQGSYDKWLRAHLLRRWTREFVLDKTTKANKKSLGKAKEWLEATIGDLKPQHPASIRELGLRRQLSEVHLLLGNLAEAVAEAERAVQEDLERPSPRHTLACVLWAVKEYCKALSEWEVCLSLEPDAELLTQIVHSLNPLKIDEFGGQRYTKTLKRSSRLLDRIHRHLESQPWDSQKDNPGLRSDKWALIHERLGLINLLLGNYESSYHYLAIAEAMSPELSKEARKFLRGKVDRLADKHPEAWRFRRFT